eukprot:s3131_g6.t1
MADVTDGIAAAVAPGAAPDDKADAEPKQKGQRWYLCWLLLPALGILLAPLALGAFLASEVKTQSNGALLRVFDGSSLAAGVVLQKHDLMELLDLPEAVLRRVRHCSFSTSEFRSLRVASLVRSDGQVVIVSPDRSTLKIQRGSTGNTATFTRPFAREQQVDLLASQSAGCTFTAPWPN